jgi:predicted nuclease of restriction endonuclease-like RecB superfamily
MPWQPFERQTIAGAVAKHIIGSACILKSKERYGYWFAQGVKRIALKKTSRLWLWRF